MEKSLELNGSFGVKYENLNKVGFKGFSIVWIYFRNMHFRRMKRRIKNQSDQFCTGLFCREGSLPLIRATLQPEFDFPSNESARSESYLPRNAVLRRVV